MEEPPATVRSTLEKFAIGVVIAPFDIASPIIMTGNQQPTIDFDSFAKKRAIGKGLQLVGALCLSTGMFIAFDDDDYLVSSTGRPDVVKGLAIGGAVLFTTGIAIDISANKHIIRFK